MRASGPCTRFIIMNLLGRSALSFVIRKCPKNKSTLEPTMLVTSDSARSFATSSEASLVLDPLVVCGPSGVGKGTIITKYMEELGGKNRFGFTVSHTTRIPRPGEMDGIHYHFTSHDAIRREIEAGAFLEHAEVHGNIYGTSWASVRDVQFEQGKKCLLDIDVQGVRRLKSLENESLSPAYIFIAPPSLERLEQRLADRGTESAESLARRTQNARQEVEYGLTEGNFDYIVVNDDLDEACRQFENAIREIYPEWKD